MSISRIPARRFQDYVPRRALVDRVIDDLEDRMILIIAPSGYGKASLLSETYDVLSGSDTCDIFWISINESLDSAELIEELFKLEQSIDEERKNYFFIDKIDLLADEELSEAMLIIQRLFLKGVRITLTSTRFTKELLTCYVKGLVKIYDRHSLAFGYKETEEYLRTKNKEASLDYIQQVFRFTKGWIEGIYLLSNNYPTGGGRRVFSQDKFIDRFFSQLILRSETKDTYEFLLQTSLLDKLDPEDRTDEYITGEDYYNRGDTFFDKEYEKLGYWEIKKMDPSLEEKAKFGRK